MRVLAIETSCDETGAAVLEKENEKVRVLSNVIFSSADLHAKTGGIIPEMASREQVKIIIPSIIEALLASQNDTSGKNQKNNFTKASTILKDNIDAIAVTKGPGLIGSLLVGVETAKTLSFSLKKPLIPVNHLLAHIFANAIDNKVHFPFIGLIVSGGHTDLLYFKNIDDYKWLGGTRDDAAGEAIDKIGRLLNLSYPAGPEMEMRARRATDKSLRFTSPLIDSEDFDFSFSGLKAECARFIEKKHLTERLIDEICTSVQDAIFKVLVKKTIRALKMYEVNNLCIGGGVSANNYLLENMENEIKKEKLDVNISIPKKEYATDNAAMIGAYALLDPKAIDWHEVTAEPELYFD